MSRPAQKRLAAALVCYAALASAASVTLEGLFRAAVLLLLGALALKTLLALRRD